MAIYVYAPIVLQVPQTSHYWYQKALLTSELEEIFRNAPTAPNAMANARIREAYERAAGKKASSSEALQNRRVPSEEDDCPVCYENMHGAKETSLVWCEACGNALHKECFQQWAKKKIGTPDCVYCRAPWAGAGSRNAGSSRWGDGYVNLASVAGLSPVRDTSTYYHGPRRGQRFYGYQDYDD
ncbi:uncharacterized protein FOMMEDRAFT_86698 [Fomitiporia mediterranea MF3/22]|uniref:uncharacterized protein n=1 Tax=Fomitiporia mediterranea (strain MF3/22) TaxID=694068 RepID=UPI0004408A24|nr:uncharacterized protein FOMMEDRAFT_86698 [Fomitiporia mediterranea MF3/22]EJD02122.1 hypothetical protein FOMMEDRAFT_86698 [Fomitiporia mediterranea MF3/22]